MTSLPRLLLIPGVQYGLEDYRAPPSSWKLSFPLKLITTPSLAPRARYLHSQPPDLALPQQQQVVGPKFMDIDRAWTTQKLHQKQETMKLMCLRLQGPEEKRLEPCRRKLGRK